MVTRAFRPASYSPEGDCGGRSLTLRERKFAKLMDRFDSNNTIFKGRPDLVEIVESGRLGDHDLVMRTLHGYFDQYDMEHIDSVVLGCTCSTATTSASCCPNGLLSSMAMKVPCAIWAWC